MNKTDPYGEFAGVVGIGIAEILALLIAAYLFQQAMERLRELMKTPGYCPWKFPIPPINIPTNIPIPFIPTPGFTPIPIPFIPTPGFTPIPIPTQIPPLVPPAFDPKTLINPMRPPEDVENEDKETGYSDNWLRAQKKYYKIPPATEAAIRGLLNNPDRGQGRENAQSLFDSLTKGPDPVIKRRARKMNQY